MNNYKHGAKKKESGFNDEVLLAYFYKISKKYSPSSLWSKFSMLKLMLQLKENIDIQKFYKLTSYIKRLNVGYKPKKSKVLEKEQTEQFLIEAPNEVYLMIKVAAIFGIAGACRREELMKLTVDDVEDKEDLLVVSIKATKTNVSRKFVICDPGNEKISYLGLFRKYVALRPAATPHRRFFIQYKAGKCSQQCVGINTFGKMPTNIAGFLRLPNPEMYTGHCFRRSSATMLAESGSNITNIKRHGGWKSTSVAESYIEDSLQNKKRIAQNILQSSSTPNRSTEQCSTLTAVAVTETLEDAPSLPTRNNPPPTPLAIFRSQQSTVQCTAQENNSSVIYQNCSPTTDEQNQARSALNLHCATNCTFNFNIYR